MLGGVLGIVLTPVLTYLWASYSDVYGYFGRAYFPVYLGCTAGLAGLYAIRKASLGQHGTPQPDPEKIVFGMSFAGLIIGLVGNVLEYWGGTPGEDFTWVQMQGFGIELLGLMLVLFGSVAFGLTYRRASVLPSLVAWLLIAAGPGGILFSILLHAPSGTLLLFCCAWVVLGYLLLTGRVASAEQTSRISLLQRGALPSPFAAELLTHTLSLCRGSGPLPYEPAALGLPGVPRRLDPGPHDFAVL
jgi:hypothetical protein